MDIRQLIEEHRSDLYSKHVGPKWARMLRTIGFDRAYMRSEGPYLFDSDGTKYLDCMCNWGVFNFGRHHPIIRKALRDVIESDLPGWVAFDTPPLAAVLAQRPCERMSNDLDRVFFCNSGTEAVEAAIKFARVATGKFTIVHLEGAFHGMTNGSLSVSGSRPSETGYRENETMETRHNV